MPRVSRPASRVTSSRPAGVQTSRYEAITTPHPGTVADHQHRHKPLPNGKQSLTGARGNPARRGDRAVTPAGRTLGRDPTQEVDHEQAANPDAGARRRAAARTLAVAAALAALVATLGAGQALAARPRRTSASWNAKPGSTDHHTAAIRQALAAEAVPDERILERQGEID